MKRRSRWNEKKEKVGKRKGWSSGGANGKTDVVAKSQMTNTRRRTGHKRRRMEDARHG